MLHNFEAFVARHGEVAAQAILENLERYEGIRANHVSPLEDRWQAVIAGTFHQQQAA